MYIIYIQVNYSCIQCAISSVSYMCICICVCVNVYECIGVDVYAYAYMCMSICVCELLIIHRLSIIYQYAI